MTTPANTVMNERATTDFIPPSTGQSVAAILSILGWQTLAGVAASVLALAVFGQLAGFSAMLGALICLTPSAAFAVVVALGISFSHAPKLQLHGFYVGEVLKLALTVIAFTVVFTTVKTLSPLFLFTGFIVTQVAMIAVLLRG